MNLPRKLCGIKPGFKRWSAGITLILVSQSTWSLGLGQMEAQAQVGQPFTAEIEIIGTGTNIDAIRVRRVVGDEAKALGYDPVGSHYPLVLEVKSGNGKPYIRVYSSKPLNEPFLEFVIELAWPQGNVLREFLVLPTQPPTGKAESREAYRWQSSELNADQANSGSEFGAGVILKSDVSGPNSPKNFYTVQPGDSISAIAITLRDTNGESSVNEIMRWLHQHNSHAFIDNDINKLMAGARLSTPGEQPLPGQLVYSSRNASSIYRGQTSPQTSTGGTDSRITSPKAEGRLVVNTAPIQSDSNLASSELNSLKVQIDSAKEEIVRLTRENDNLKQRLDKLESGEIESVLNELLALQKGQIDLLKQQLDSTQTTGQIINSDDGFLENKLNSAEVEIEPEQEITGKGANILYWLLFGACFLSVITWLYSRNTNKKPKKSHLAQQKFKEPEKLQELKHSKPSNLSSNRENERVTAMSLANEISSKAEQQSEKEEPEASLDDLVGFEATNLPDQKNVDITKEQDWIHRQFGESDDNDKVTTAELLETDIEGLDVDPYDKKDNLDMMKLRLNETITPEFELDESLIGDADLESDTEADDTLFNEIFDDVSLSDLEVEFGAAEQAQELGGEENSGRDLDVRLAEVEMYLQLGQKEKAKRLLELVVLQRSEGDEASAIKEDPRIKNLLAQCHLDQASGAS